MSLYSPTPNITQAPGKHTRSRSPLHFTRHQTRCALYPLPPHSLHAHHVCLDACLYQTIGVIHLTRGHSLDSGPGAPQPGNLSRKPRLPSLSPCTGSRLPGLTRQGGLHTLQRPKDRARAMWIIIIMINLNLNIDGCGVVAPPVHSSLRAPHLLANLLAHNLPLPRAAH